MRIEKAGTFVIAMKLDFNSGTRLTVTYGKNLVNWDEGQRRRKTRRQGEAEWKGIRYRVAWVFDVAK
ncbi:MAG: hypothetical protein LBT31_07585 [Synergistaceae bacterium]|nr:hypothetical protein [Synergistaceae bacterium]